MSNRTLTRDDGERLGGIASLIESVAEVHDDRVSRDVRYLRQLSEDALAAEPSSTPVDGDGLEATGDKLHRLAFDFEPDSDQPKVKLIHPKGSCEMATQCGECGMSTGDPEFPGCELCPDPELDACWVEGWFDQFSGRELLEEVLAGPVEIPVIPECDGDTLLLHVAATPVVEEAPERVTVDVEVLREKLLSAIFAELRGHTEYLRSRATMRGPEGREQDSRAATAIEEVFPKIRKAAESADEILAALADLQESDSGGGGDRG